MRIAGTPVSRPPSGPPNAGMDGRRSGARILAPLLDDLRHHGHGHLLQARTLVPLPENAQRVAGDAGVTVAGDAQSESTRDFRLRRRRKRRR
jgi:hypothetical protein